MNHMSDIDETMNATLSRADTTDPVVPDRILSKAAAEGIIRTVMSYVQGRGHTEVFVGSIWHQTIRWARNTVILSGDRQRQLVLLARNVQGFGQGTAASNQFDEISLRNMVRIAEGRASLIDGSELRADPFLVDAAKLDFPDVPLWSDTTAQATAESRARLATLLSEQAHAKGMLSAGAVEMRMVSYAKSDSVYGTYYGLYTQAESSVTVRHPKGTGSGWAGESGFDWSRIDTTAIAERALDKCLASVDPVRIEPGRYTVVLEPQAVYELARVLVTGFSRALPENEGRGPYALGKDNELNMWMTKLGMQVIDERITISHNPTETGTAVIPERGMAPITWIRDGILTTLHDGESVADRIGSSLPRRNENIPNYERRSFRMSGGNTTVEQMIGTTKRGLLVSRFSDVTEIDERSALSTGVTRDGLWLIENGKISKPVKNLRFVESPLFVLNRVEQLGEPVQVFRRSISGGGNFLGSLEFMFGPWAAVVPPIKANDFNFAALVDAV